MKRFLIILTAILSISVLSLTNVKAATLPKVTSHDKVTIYIFRGHGCSHCYGLINYLYNNMSKYTDYINVVAYEVWNDSNNQALMNAVGTAKNETVQGVPYIIIGSDYSKNGYGSSTDGDAIIEEALKEYQDDSYSDLVAKTLKSTNYGATAETLAQAASAEGVTSTDSSSSSNSSSSSTNDSTTAATNNTTTATKKNNDTYIVIGIFALVIGGIVALIASANKKK